MTMRTGSMDHYDTVYCVGKHHTEEIRKTEEAYGLPPKKLIDWGYCLLDRMIEDYRKADKTPHEKKHILIALPGRRTISWTAVWKACWMIWQVRVMKW